MVDTIGKRSHKKESYQAWLPYRTLGAVNRYPQTKWSAALSVAEAKTQILEECSEAKVHGIQLVFEEILANCQIGQEEEVVF